MVEEGAPEGQPATQPPPADPAPKQTMPRYELLPETFPRSARALTADGFRSAGVALGVSGLALAGWAMWFGLARIPVYVTSTTARIEGADVAWPVENPVPGRIVALHMGLNDEVDAGDVLVELDARAERLEVTEAQARCESLTASLATLEAELEAHHRALEQTARATVASIAEAQSQTREAEATAELAEQEATRTQRLREGGLVSEAELLRRQAEAGERRASAESRRLAIERLRSEGDATLASMRSRAAELARERDRLRGDLGACESTRMRHETSVGDREIRAARSGRVGDLADLRVGDFVDEGTRLCTIVTDGELRVVAFFRSWEAIGRVALGQRARVRLDGYPWTQFGTVPAVVAAVGTEPRDGLLRVELAATAASSPITLRHGLTGVAEIETERVSPATLVLRAAAIGSRSPRPAASGMSGPVPTTER